MSARQCRTTAIAARLAAVRRGAGGPARQRGIGMAELMVALALGLLVVLVSATMLHAADIDFSHNGAFTRVDDNGRFALGVLSQSLRQAGYAGEPGALPAPPDASGSPPLAVLGRDAASVAASADGMGFPLPPVHGSDVLALRYAPSGSGSGAPGDAMLNCAGFPSAAGEWAWSIFYVARAADGEPELRCKYKGGHSWAADAVIRGVDAFHVLYGIDLDTPRDGAPNRYLNATAIDALDAALPDPERTQRPHWRRVVSVRLALLLHGEAHSRPGGPLASFDLLPDGDPAARLDESQLPGPMQHRARRAYVATVALRNHQ